MATQEEWNTKAIAAGAQEWSSRCYPAEFLEKNDLVDVFWLDKDDTDYTKVRNKFAREMRKDGFKVVCESSPCMGKTFIKLDAERCKGD